MTTPSAISTGSSVSISPPTSGPPSKLKNSRTHYVINAAGALPRRARFDPFAPLRLALRVQNGLQLISRGDKTLSRSGFRRFINALLVQCIGDLVHVNAIRRYIAPAKPARFRYPQPGAEDKEQRPTFRHHSPTVGNPYGLCALLFNWIFTSDSCVFLSDKT